MASSPSNRPSESERLAAIALAGGRLAVGAGIWLAPAATLRALGFSALAGPQELAVARIAGTRDLVLGAWQLSVLGDRERLGRATNAVAMCDAGDTLTFGLLLAAGQRRAGWRGLAGAGAAAVLGLGLSTSLRQRER